MFLLKRKADGKFWKNTDFHSRSRTGADWISDPSQCRPFMTKSGAMTSRGGVVPCPFPRPDYTDEVAWKEYWRLQGEWYSPKNSGVRIARWHEIYEVVPVLIMVKG